MIDTCMKKGPLDMLRKKLMKHMGKDFIMAKEKEFIKKSFEEMDEMERLKFETAVELGLADRLLEKGWKSLSASETGKIGGIMNRKIKERKRE